VTCRWLRFLFFKPKKKGRASLGDRATPLAPTTNSQKGPFVRTNKGILCLVGLVEMRANSGAPTESRRFVQVVRFYRTVPFCDRRIFSFFLLQKKSENEKKIKMWYTHPETDKKTVVRSSLLARAAALS
jgi:hypothetical protein